MLLILCFALTELDGETSWHVKLVLEGASWFILLIFLAEIIIKWLFSFNLFWKSAWNVFDFIVTILVRIDILRTSLVG